MKDWTKLDVSLLSLFQEGHIDWDTFKSIVRSYASQEYDDTPRRNVDIQIALSESEIAGIKRKYAGKLIQILNGK